MTSGACAIEYRQFPVRLPLVPLRLAVHGMLVVRDGDTVLHVLEGLATGADGAVKAIGRVRSDSIRFYDRGLAYEWRLGLALAPPQTLFAGGEDETRARVAVALAAGAAINARDLGYPPWGVFRHLAREGRRGRGLANSNAVISTLVRAMGLARERPSLFAPGAGVRLLVTRPSPPSARGTASGHWTRDRSAEGRSERAPQAASSFLPSLLSR